MSARPQEHRHGHAAYRGRPSPTYTAWQNMLARCARKNHPSYPRYGGRGVTVCERWQDFRNFLDDMGEKPTGKSIDRINNDGAYEPGNCRWSTQREQCRNIARNRLITFRGETRCVSEWAEVLGLNVSSINYRLSAGWTDERALTEPMRKR